MRDDRLYLADILEACDDIADFLRDTSPSQFERNRMMSSAVLQRLFVIGEACGQVSRELRGRHPEVPWSTIKAFRNIVVHTYFDLDGNLIWQAATDDVPKLRAQIAAVLATEFP